MATLDFSDILEDGDVAGVSFDVIRRAAAVNPANGRSTIVETPFPGQIGAVTPGDAGNLLRQEDSASTSNVITVTAAFMLRAASEGVQPDIIVYDGIRYTVKAVKRWNRLGGGFIKAVAESENASDAPPGNT